ncbi:MAG: electron transport complex subunit RsxE [Spirochaetota bacterium]
MAPGKKEEPVSFDTLTQGVWRDNMVFVNLLGLCPALAVSNTAINSLAMGLASTFVLLGSSFIISLLRNFIPKQVRIACFIIIIATFVTVVDYAIQAISLDLYNALGAFIQLIVVNCMILGRMEAHSSKNKVPVALVNALGMGAGFTLALFFIGSIREILGAGTFFGVSLFGSSFQTWAIFVSPPGGFIVIALLIALFAVIERMKAERAAHRTGEAAHAA